MRTESKIAVAFLTTGVGVAGLVALRSRLNLATVALVLMLIVIATALYLGRAAAFVSAVLASLCLNFFFIPPLHAFTIASPQNVAALLVFLVAGLIVAQLSSRAREERDRSERRRQESEQLYLELQRVTQENRERQALIQAEKVKTAFLDAVTHDLRTPLTSIKAGATSLLQERFLAESRSESARVRELLNVIVEEADRLNRFIDGMIELARLEGGATSLRVRNASAREIVEAALERAAPRLAGHRIEVRIAAGLPELMVDPQAIAEVLYTLLDNAAKYSREYSRIDVNVERSEDTLRFTVADEGRGIPATMRKKVFERFVRAESGQQGFGMGLAIARAIVEAHQGKIWIEGRRTGQGTAMHFALPLHTAGRSLETAV